MPFWAWIGTAIQWIHDICHDTVPLFCMICIEVYHLRRSFFAYPCSKVVIFRAKKMANKFEDDKVVFEGEIKGRALSTWVKENM